MTRQGGRGGRNRAQALYCASCLRRWGPACAPKVWVRIILDKERSAYSWPTSRVGGGAHLFPYTPSLRPPQSPLALAFVPRGDKGVPRGPRWPRTVTKAAWPFLAPGRWPRGSRSTAALWPLEFSLESL